jgi:hypothetical protein
VLDKKALQLLHVTYSSLGELTGTLILGVLDQFHDTALIRSKASDLTNDGADKDDALASLYMIFHSRVSSGRG